MYFVVLSIRKRRRRCLVGPLTRCNRVPNRLRGIRTRHRTLVGIDVTERRTWAFVDINPLHRDWIRCHLKERKKKWEGLPHNRIRGYQMFRELISRNDGTPKKSRRAVFFVLFWSVSVRGTNDNKRLKGKGVLPATHAMRPFTVAPDSDADSSSPLGLDTSKTASTDAARMKSVASTKCRPGQMRFPPPKASGIADASLMRCCRRRSSASVPSSPSPPALALGAWGPLLAPLAEAEAAAVPVPGRKRSGLNVSGSG